jgi:hypothetical protein
MLLTDCGKGGNMKKTAREKVLNDAEFGQRVKKNENETSNTLSETAEYDKYIEIMKGYQSAKQPLEENIIANEKWYKSNHWDLIRGKGKTNKTDARPEPVTAYLFSILSNKHADAIDNFPAPNILEREDSDKETALELTEIIPVILERNEFRETWDHVWWYKLKQGTGVYGVFWDNEAGDGLGDIAIKKLDLLNIYWEPRIEKIDESRYLFVTKMMDLDLVKKEYPEKATKLKIDSNFKPLNYEGNQEDSENQILIIDVYHRENGRLDLVKIAGGCVLESTEDNSEYPDGLYKHGKYPIIFDPLFPMEDYPVGFGFIDIVKSPQIYVDKLDQIISENALESGRVRHLVSKGLGVNIEDFNDMSKRVVECEGSITQEKYQQLQSKPLDAFIVNHRENKIQEMKEIAADNQFSRGEGGKGITAASAIQALQEAASKVSRDMISSSYRSYTQIIYRVMSIISTNYTEERKFRITNKFGKPDYKTFGNEKLLAQKLPKAFENEGMMEDETGVMIDDPDYQQAERIPVFDITVMPEKDNPFSRTAMNEFAKNMFQIGMFNPELTQQALITLEMMHFEGREKVMEQIKEQGDMFQQMQKMKETMDKMAQIIEHFQGKGSGDGQGLGNGQGRGATIDRNLQE